MSNAQSLYKGRFLELWLDGTWEFVSRPQARGAAFIAAVTAEHELVLVEQWRVPVAARSIELPAGIIGDEAEFADESHESAASRELEEETGYRPSHMELLLTSPTAPGMSSERIHLFLATGLRKVGAGGGVADENIRVHVVPIRGIEDWLMQRQAEGCVIETRIFTALWFISQRLPDPLT